MSDVRERIRAVHEAKEALTKALCALVMKPYTDDEAIATSLFFASLAIVRLADADGVEERARTILLRELDAEKARRAEASTQ